MSEIIHMGPPDGSGLTPCCGKTPFEIGGRITLHPELVTCRALADSPRNEGKDRAWKPDRDGVTGECCGTCYYAMRDQEFETANPNRPVAMRLRYCVKNAPCSHGERKPVYLGDYCGEWKPREVVGINDLGSINAKDQPKDCAECRQPCPWQMVRLQRRNTTEVYTVNGCLPMEDVMGILKRLFSLEKKA